MATKTYRPILTDVNAFFQPKLSKKLGLDFMAGIGIASNRFNLLGSCSIPGCVNYTSSNHFMEDLGVGVRYRFWHRLPHIFVRPEAHYYHIQNNRSSPPTTCFASALRSDTHRSRSTDRRKIRQKKKAASRDAAFPSLSPKLYGSCSHSSASWIA